MASLLLRVSKYFAGISRLNVIKYSKNVVEKGLIANSSRCFSTSYVTRTVESLAPQPTEQRPSTLSTTLLSLDNFAKSYGRLNRKNVDKIFEEILSGELVTSSQALLIIPCCGHLLADEIPSTRTQLALKFWKTFEDLGIELNVNHYNALLRVYLDNEHDFSPNDFLSMLKTKGIEPDRVTYLRLMSHFCRLGNMDGATAILQTMRDEQLPINEKVFNTLLMGHCQAGDMPSALSILDLMQQASVHPSNETYRALLCGYAKSGDMEGVRRNFQQCKEKRIFLQNNDYLEVIYTLAANGWAKHLDMVIALINKSMGYNQDCVCLILRLVNINQPDVAFKMLKTMIPAVKPDGKSADAGSFFIRQLVKTKQPAEKIIEICNAMKDKAMHHQALYLAATTSLKYGAGHGDLSIPLLTVLKDSSTNLPPSHFWPLLSSYCKAGEKTGIKNVIKCMTESFNIFLDVATLRDRMLPFLPKDMSSGEMITIIEHAKNSRNSAAFGVLCYRLLNNDIIEAGKIAAAYRVFYVVPVLRKPLTSAYLHTKDIDSYLAILRKAVSHACQVKKNLLENMATPNDIIGRFVVELAEQLSTEDSNTKALTFTTVFQRLLSEGLGINEETNKHVKKTLGDEITNELSTLIDQITTLQTTFLPSVRELPKNVAVLEKMLSAHAKDPRAVLLLETQLLRVHCQNFDLAQAERLKEKLEKVTPFSPGLQIMLMDLYVRHEMLDKAWSIYQSAVQLSPELIIKNMKVVKLATLLVKHDRCTECVQLLFDQNVSKPIQTDMSESYRKACNVLLFVLAEKGKVDELKTIYNALIVNNYLPNSSLFLGPLVKVHIIREDFPAAFDEFKRCCYEHKVTPYKDELCCKLIMLEHLDMLQEVTDLSTMIHGEVNTIFDLLFSFVECGKMGHASKILETAGVSNRPKRIIAGCNRLLKKNMFQELEGLLDITKNSGHVLDRSLIYDSLMEYYGRTNNAEKRAELQTRMTGDLVQKDNKQPERHINPTALRVRQLSRQSIKNRSQNQNFKLPQSNIEVYNLVNAYCLETIEGKINPTIHELKFVFKQLADVGEVDRIEEMKNVIPETMNKNVRWERFLCTASATAGRGEEYLEKLEHQINDAKAEDAETLAVNYPRGASSLILKHKPELKQRFEDMARCYAIRDILHPINDLWAHLFVSGEESQAGELWSEFLEKKPLVVLKHVLQTATLAGDTDLAQRLVNQLRCSEKEPKITAAAYTCLIDIYVTKKQSDDALKALEAAKQDGVYNKLKPVSIMDLQDLLKSEGKSLPPHLLVEGEVGPFIKQIKTTGLPLNQTSIPQV